jgi:hypothetical protein
MATYWGIAATAKRVMDYWTDRGGDPIVRVRVLSPVAVRRYWLM